MSFPNHPLLTPVLALPAALYGALMERRNRRFDRPGAVQRAELPVISVGNLTVGGTGKTPTVAWLAQRLLGAGHRPAVVSRGYGGRAGRGPLVVATGNGPLIPVEQCGDEPWWLARRVDGLRVVVGSDRVAGAAQARQLGADVILLDDGFQHRRLGRDLDIVLLDAGRPFGNGRLLPAGPLREAPSGLRRADIVLGTRATPATDLDALQRQVAGYAPSLPVLLASHRPLGFVDLHGHPSPAPQRAVAFCGIARPESFREALAQSGVEIAHWRPFGDHHGYRPAELAALLRVAGDLPLVTTEKDLARLGVLRGSFPEGRLCALRVGLEVAGEERLLAAVRHVLERRS